MSTLSVSNRMSILEKHKDQLLEQRKEIDLLIDAVNQKLDCYRKYLARQSTQERKKSNELDLICVTNWVSGFLGRQLQRRQSGRRCYGAHECRCVALHPRRHFYGDHFMGLGAPFVRQHPFEPDSIRDFGHYLDFRNERFAVCWAQTHVTNQRLTHHGHESFGNRHFFRIPITGQDSCSPKHRSYHFVDRCSFCHHRWVHRRIALCFFRRSNGSLLKHLLVWGTWTQVSKGQQSAYHKRANHAYRCNLLCSLCQLCSCACFSD
jgi:hypothetical protein